MYIYDDIEWGQYEEFETREELLKCFVENCAAIIKENIFCLEDLELIKDSDSYMHDWIEGLRLYKAETIDPLKDQDFAHKLKKLKEERCLELKSELEEQDAKHEELDRQAAIAKKAQRYQEYLELKEEFEGK